MTPSSPPLTAAELAALAERLRTDARGAGRLQLTSGDLELAASCVSALDAMEKALDRDFIARHILYATGMFDTPAEIAANPEHRLVVTAYKTADAIRAATALKGKTA